MVERGTGPKSLMEGSKGCQEPGGSLTVCDVCCVVHQKSVPLVGSPALPFIDQGGSRGYRWEKEENTKGIEGPSKDPGLLNMADRVRSDMFVDLRRPCPGPI